MENSFGHDFSRVRVHTDARAAESARAVNALAYTVGRNVVFGGGQYAPGAPAGRQLIAHELTHVLQQGTAATSPARGLSLGESHGQSELEAERAASLAGAGSDVRVSFAGPALVQRKAPANAPPPVPPVEKCPFPSDFADQSEAGLNMQCVSDAAFKKSPSCTLTDKHVELINAARVMARRLVQKANGRMYMVGGPEYAQRLAGRVFKDTPPDAKSIKSTLDKVVQILQGQSLSFTGATCADPLCESKGQHAVAYESGPLNPVALCPRSFLPEYLPELPRTIIHEAVHLSGIDIDPNVEERYCTAYTCDTPCQDATFADAWTLFLDCLGRPLPQHKPAYAPRADFDAKTTRTIEGEFGR
jgi:hypothetical protein